MIDMTPLNKDSRASRNRSWRDCLGIAPDQALLAGGVKFRMKDALKQADE